MNRGYAGFYKNFYLRSSYEYAYAVHLDYMNIPWSYEDRNFQVNGKNYKPDFFFYDENGELYKIVEVKSRNKIELKKAKERLVLIEEYYKIKTQLISYKDLLEIYNEMPVSLHAITQEWINSESTTINKSNRGQLNSHYGLKHSIETKRKIGAHTKKLWDSESVAKQRMLEGLQKSGKSQLGKIKTKREKRLCPQCSKKFIVLVTSKKQYCSRNCSGQNAITHATNIYVEQRKLVHREIREYLIQWAKDNKELVLNTQFNKINSTIKPLINEIHIKFDVKDLRVISKAVFGEDKGRKELLRFMKKICSENVC